MQPAPAAFRTVSRGLRLMLYAVWVCLLASGGLLLGAVVGLGWVELAGMAATLAGVGMGVVGKAMCLTVPAGTRLIRPAGRSLACDLLFLLATLLLATGSGHQLLNPLRAALAVVGFLFFLYFLVRLARCRGDGRMARLAAWVLGLGAALAVVGAGCVLLLRWSGVPAGRMAVVLLILWAGAGVTVMLYSHVLDNLSRAVLYHEPSEPRP
ncbi:MAG TPA: hypothetical protein VFA26_06905 [Gemmataceae bacterium]|nr:hypothetical protein [Gemmataceae bacterium]